MSNLNEGDDLKEKDENILSKLTGGKLDSDELTPVQKNLFLMTLKKNK